MTADGTTYRSKGELKKALTITLRKIKDLARGARVSIWLLNESKTDLDCVVSIGPRSKLIISRSIKAKKNIRALKKSTSHTSKDDFWLGQGPNSDPFSGDGFHSIYFPLPAPDHVLGMIAITMQTGATIAKAKIEKIKKIAYEIAGSIQNTKLYEEHKSIEKRQKLLNHINQHLHETLVFDELIPRIFSDVKKAIQAEAQSIWLVDEMERTITCRYSIGPRAEALKGFSVSMDASSIVGTSVSRMKSIITRDAHNDPRRAREADEATGFDTKSLMTVPLILGNKSIGAIQAVNKRGGKLFSQTDLDLLRAIAETAALAVNNAQLVTELQSSYDQTLEALASALDLRDRETEGHSRRVVEFTARLAEQIGLSKDRIKTIRRGALIHDIGKIGVPDAILHKPGKLDEKEFSLIKRHPEAGYNMLADVSHLQSEIQIVLYHQEKWNGSGYPFGMKGEQIPLGARLFAVADTFDALTSNRPYRNACTYTQARKIIEEESGKQFDPKIAAAFCKIPANEWDEIRNRVIQQTAQRREIKAHGFKPKELKSSSS